MHVQFGRMRQRKRRGKMQSMFPIPVRKNRKHARTLRRIQKEMQRIVYTGRIRDAGEIIFQKRRKFAKIKIRCFKNFAEKKSPSKAHIFFSAKFYFEFDFVSKSFFNFLRHNSVGIFWRRFAESVLAIFISTRTN